MEIDVLQQSWGFWDGFRRFDKFFQESKKINSLSMVGIFSFYQFLFFKLDLSSIMAFSCFVYIIRHPFIFCFSIHLWRYICALFSFECCYISFDLEKKILQSWRCAKRTVFILDSFSRDN